MGKREELFKDEASAALDELKQVAREMETDGTCLSEEIRRIADSLDEIWLGVLRTVEETEDTEDANTEEG